MPRRRAGAGRIGHTSFWDRRFRLEIYNRWNFPKLYCFYRNNCTGRLMIDFLPVRDRGRAPTLVEQTVDAFVHAIEKQAVRPGMAVPSVREFARLHGLSTFTVASAYNRLVAQGWLDSRPGAGYRVAVRARGARHGAVQTWQPPQLGAAWLLSDIYADHSVPIKAGCGWLPPEWVDETGLHQALRHQARVPAAQIGGYGHPYGYAPLREQVAAGLADHGMQVEPAQVLLTQGVTQGLDLVVRTLLKPGDTVVVESPCYTNLLQMLRLAGMRAAAVARTADGLDIGALEAAAELHPRALFVNSALQNPTGTTLSMSNAFRILQVAERHGMWVVEDDISRPLLGVTAPVLAALDGGNRVIHLGGYSKTISPSMRVGYVVAQRDLVRDLARTKMAVGLTSPELMERIVHRVVRDGYYRPHVERVRERLTLAHGQVTAHMEDLGMEIYAQPRAGLFLWARPAAREAGRGSNRLAELALRDGIWLAPGSFFDVEDRDTPWLRFNVAYAQAPTLWRFLARTQ